MHFISMKSTHADRIQKRWMPWSQLDNRLHCKLGILTIICKQYVRRSRSGNMEVATGNNPSWVGREALLPRPPFTAVPFTTIDYWVVILVIFSIGKSLKHFTINCKKKIHSPLLTLYVCMYLFCPKGTNPPKKRKRKCKIITQKVHSTLSPKKR